MQNLPTSQLFSLFDPYLQSGPKDRPDFSSWNDDFKNIFQNVVDSGNNQEGTWGIRENQNYTPQDQDGHVASQIHLDDEMNREEFAAVKDVLEQNGFPPENIAKLEARFESEGLTWRELKNELSMSDEFEQFVALIKNSIQGTNDKGLEFLQHDLSKEDFEAVKQVLLDHGFNAEQIQNLEKKFQKDGFTWDELIAHLDLGQLSKKVELNAGDKTELMSFFAALGFNSNESQGLMKQLQQGEHSKVWTRISEKLENMPADQKLALSREQVGSLLKVLGIDSKDIDKFAGFVGKDLGKSELSNFLALLKKEGREARSSAIMNQLAQAKAEGAGSRGQESLLTEILRIAKKEEKNGDKDSSQKLPLTDSKEKGSGDRQGEQSLFDRINDKSEARSEARSEDGGQSKSKEDPWEKFLSKIRNADSADMKNATIADAKARAAADAARQKAGVQQREFISRQVLEQVQNGMFKNLGNGRTQLTLQLDPPDLGRVGIILQVHDKEVRALIRPSSPEVAQMVSENMSRLKASLEQQGLRVSKIEVQTQTQENHGQTWHGQEEHNKARDRMREAVRVARMRGLDMDGRAGSGIDGAVIADVQSQGETRLDLFA